MRRPVVTFFVAAFGGGLLAVACGATETDQAPKAEQRSDIRACRGFDQLMPNFVKAIDQGQTQNLKKVVEEQLLKPLREGDAPPVNDVLAAVFNTLTAYASLPPEVGATGGDYCAPSSTPPTLANANPLCELRRALELLVHQGKGIEAINLIQPQLTILLNYITGNGNDCKGKPRTAHYEIAAIFSNLCTQDANCQLSNGLDLAIGISVYVQQPDGKKLVDDLYNLAAKSSVLDLLDPTKLTEDDAVAIVKGLVPAFQSADSAGLEAAFSSLPLPDQVKTDLRPVIDDLKKLLDTPSVIVPVRRALNCITGKDKNYDVVRMLYRVAIGEQCADFGLTKLTKALQDIQTVDQRRSVAFVVQQLATSVRRDENAIDSAAAVCKTLFSTAKGLNQPRSNAELVLPEATNLVEGGVINEAICAADTLLFGCTGGAQPACR